MKIAFYCPNKSLSDPHPSGDLIIARGIQAALNLLGHDCREIVQFRARLFWKSPERIPRAIAACAKAYVNALYFRPDVWLTYHTYYKSPDVLGPLVCRLQSIPYVLFQPMYSTKRRKTREARLGFYLNRLAMQAAKHAFTNNRNDVEALTRILPASQVTYLAPGIFPEEFQRNEEAGIAVRSDLGISIHTPLIVSVARLRKGVKFESMVYLLRSLSMLRERELDFRLLIVGDGPMEGGLRALAQAFLPGQTIFAGRVARERMFRYYSAADIFVFPGIGESLGMVFLEAQSCSLPVVALNTAGASQVVNSDVTALLVPEDDGHFMALAVERLLDGPDLRRKMGAQGYEFVRRERNLLHNYRELADKLQIVVDKWKSMPK